MSNQYVQTQVVCAQCAAIRGETNHWFELWVFPRERGSLIGEIAPEIAIRPFRESSRGDFQPACGELCLLRLVAKNLEKL